MERLDLPGHLIVSTAVILPAWRWTGRATFTRRLRNNAIKEWNASTQLVSTVSPQGWITVGVAVDGRATFTRRFKQRRHQRVERLGPGGSTLVYRAGLPWA